LLAGTQGFLVGTAMAEHNEVAYTTADGNDYPAHEQTYEGFIMLVKYGTASVALILILMAIFLT
jgi:Bacterial aa3 type cytochrome c oxidase subunit IV